MNPDEFLKALQTEVQRFSQEIATESGDWIVKGFIDIYKRIYAMPTDTKVISKVLELFLLPKLMQFAEKYGYSVVLAAQQNFYPDISFVAKTNPAHKYAVDIKSTYRIDKDNVNGMTLGAFTGYFRDRNSRKNTQFPYATYKSHLVLGVIYSKRQPVSADSTLQSADTGFEDILPTETSTYPLNRLKSISSVIRDFQFFVQPKYRIATARPGSGNTRNIGSVTAIEQLVSGAGPFSALGEDIYDDYWMNYLNADMARKIGSKPPYNNLTSYALRKSQGKGISLEKAELLDELDTGVTPGADE